jgi:hypothetical protein
MGYGRHDDGIDPGMAFIAILGRIVANDLLSLAEGHHLGLLTSSIGEAAAHDAFKHLRFLDSVGRCTVSHDDARSVVILINELTRFATYMLAPRVSEEDQEARRKALELESDCAELARLLPYVMR